ncbi:uncharacterized protein LOC135138599 [Zophobas morio]|uniref:uncharacterized protein LOC135138599 n=1 Tax=Zophobas morio TaxID=2755281 RepID=UPI003082A455
MSKDPSKTAWRVIAQASGRDKKVNDIEIERNGIQLRQPKLIDNAFNNFFKDAPENVINQIPSKQNDNKNRINFPSSKESSLYLTPFHSQELVNLLLTKMKNKSSAGLDDIPLCIIKHSITTIANQLTYLVTLSFSSGKFPNLLKTSKVIPIFKKNNPQLMENYRPITITSGFLKFLNTALFRDS